MAGMLDLERSRTRRERTFIGSECAVCEEPLEHTLRGERILQFSCGHVSHEACFYEYIKEFDSQYCPTCNAPLGLDTSRGGNVLDLGESYLSPRPWSLADCPLEKLSSIVRSVSNMNNEGREPVQRSSQNTPTPWDNETQRDRPRSGESNSRLRNSQGSREYPVSQRDYQPQWDRVQRYGSSVASGGHGRNGSAGTGTGPGSSQGDFSEPLHGGRGHPYDVQAMEEITSPRVSVTKRPIPPPHVTVRSEYPTLSRSKQSQTLTCLITIEIPEGRWTPDPEDLHSAPPVQSLHHHQEKEVVHNPHSPDEESAGWLNETPEELEEITEDLRVRVENWHGLDFSR